MNRDHNFVARASLSARTQVGVLACSSSTSVAHSAVAVLVWSHVAATQVRVSAKVCGALCNNNEDEHTVRRKEGFGTLAFGISPTLLGVVGPVEMRLWPTLWVDDTRYINLTPWHQYQSPEIMLCDLRGGSIRIPTMGGFDQVGGAQGSFYRMAYCVNSMWFVECGYGTTDSGRKFMLWIQPTPRVSSSSPNDGSTSSSPAAVVTVPLPYAGRTHTLQFMSLNRQNLDEIIMVVQPWEARCSILLVRIDARLTHSSKSLSVISITRSNIDVEEHVESVIHIKCRSSHHHLEQTGCSSSFIVSLRERDGDGETWQIRQVEEVSGAARMLACSSRDERLGMSWLSGSKFTISHTDSSDYSVWDCENPEHTPLKEVSLPREVNGGEEKPPNGAGAGAAADTLAPQTQLESCCVIQVANQNQVVVYDALSEFLILTVVYPQWNSLYLGDTHSS